MRNGTLILAVAGCAAVMLLPGCGGGHSGGTAAMPPPVQSQVLDTGQLLVIALKPTETADPLTVGPAGTTLADMSDETSDPVAVTAT